MYSALLKPLSDLSHFLIKDSIINIIIIIIIIIIIVINFHIIIVIILIIIVMVHASHGSCVNSGNFSPITRSHQVLIACCRRSDSGVQREGREREKNKEEKRERGRNAFLRSHPSPTPSVVFFFLLLTSLCGVPRSERLEQTTLLIPETLFFELTVN